ncbi:sulfite exporter TauE/SafE family protein [uncultured Flavobacterium sp.]|uniref:sulfite exporter TauE/SafE family protein n=1 Tax=uncultured Flavobacterium sp. TaxID=165435 RepID=UPI0025DB2AD1|nr:sulfite exporter TauE/SafE family protein [uncultured Flavobacterium sp.]
MDLLAISGYFMALLVGVSLGLVGSGGSILTVPILVYILGFDAVTATGYSLFVVGGTALVGGLRNAYQHNVNFTIVMLFGIPSLIIAYLVRAFLIPAIPHTIVTAKNFAVTKPLLLMVLFAAIMLLAALKMIRSAPIVAGAEELSKGKIIISGIVTGLLAGAVGAGGGFLIIPALVFLAGLPMKNAVGTSLFIIAIQSLAGFAGDAFGQDIDWSFLLPFTAVAVAGIFIGILASRKIDGEKLKKGFGYFVLLMGVYIMVKELFIK